MEVDDSPLLAAPDSDEPPPEEAPPRTRPTTQSRRPRAIRSAPVEASLSQLPPLATTAEMDADNRVLYSNYIKRGRLPDPLNRMQLVQYVQRLKVNAIVALKFEEAQNHQNTLMALQKAIADQDVKDRNKERLETLDGKLGSTNSLLVQIQKETTRRLKDEMARQDERRRELHLKHDMELDDFERHWNDQEFLKKFAKPSSGLIEVKETERSMILSKMFDQAAIVRRKVQEMEKEESAQAQERAMQEMEKERAKILARQEIECRRCEHHCAKQLEWIRHEQEMKAAAVQARQVKLESEITQWKMNPPTALPPMASAIPELQHQAVMTPRTAQRYSMFKKIAKPPIVTVKPLGNVKPPRCARPRTALGR
jgi:hypothetical protein